MRLPKPILTLTSRDGVSGTTIFDDGAKTFWTEGPGVEITVIEADGHTVTEFEDGPHARAMEDGIGGPHRAMNLVEEHEWQMARYVNLEVRQ